LIILRRSNITNKGPFLIVLSTILMTIEVCY
jgi:hypothetical protein